MVQAHLKDGMSCYIIYRLIMPSEKVNLLTTTSMTTLLRPLSTIQQDVLDYLNEFSSRNFLGYLKINARGSGHRAILLVFIYNIVITIVSLYYKKSSPFDTIEISIKCLPFFCVKNWLTCIQVIGLLIYNVYQNRSNNLDERNFLTLPVIFFSIDGIPEKTFSWFSSIASTLSS